MNPERKNALALVAISLPFFMMPLAMFIMMILYVLYSIIPIAIDPVALMGFIALCGGIVFLGSTRDENPLWYLGIPLVVVFGIITINPILSGVLIIHDPSPPIWHPGVLWSLIASAGVIFFLPIGTALFIWSLRQRVRWAPWITGIALLVALNAAVLTFYALSPYLVSAGLILPPKPVYIDGHIAKSDGEGLLFMFVHFVIGLPVLGICILVLAAVFYRASQEAVPAPSPGIKLQE